MALHSISRWPIRIVGSNHTISPWEIAAVLESKSWDTRSAVEHILSLLNHQTQPGNKKIPENYSPKSYIDTPQSALETLEILFQWCDDIFDRRDSQKAEKIWNSIWFILWEYFWNLDFYTGWIHRDPDEQNHLNKKRQELTDAFHFIVWNMIDNSFLSNPQFWKISVFDINLSPEVIWSVNDFKDFPNVIRILRTFDFIYQNPHDTGLEKAA